VVVLGIACGIGLSLAFLKRVEAIRRTAEAINGVGRSRRIQRRICNMRDMRNKVPHNMVIDSATKVPEVTLGAATR
jgi:hypothetical protein